MNKKEARRVKMLNILKETPDISFDGLANLLNVSEMTIRRDTSYLKEQGFLDDFSRVINQEKGKKTIEYIFSNEKILNFEKKEKIAKYAISLIEEQDIIILDSGTTTSLAAAYLPSNIKLTILCYNFQILSHIYDKENLTVIFAGGHLHRKCQIFECSESVKLINRTRANKLFLSVSGIHQSLGLTCSNEYEVKTKEAAMNSSLERILLADSSKFGRVRPGYFAKIDELDMIISDKDLSQEWKDYIRMKKISLILV